MKNIFILTILMFLVGCSTFPNRVGEQLDGQWIVVGYKKQVEVHAQLSLVAQQMRNSNRVVYKNIWFIRLANNGENSICALPRWRTMDYANKTINNWLYLNPQTKKIAGTFEQETWTWGATTIALPDAKIQLEDLYIVDPVRYNLDENCRAKKIN